MPFWTVEDAGPYKEKSNILMRTTHLRIRSFLLFEIIKEAPIGLGIFLGGKPPFVRLVKSQTTV